MIFTRVAFLGDRYLRGLSSQIVNHYDVLGGRFASLRRFEQIFAFFFRASRCQGAILTAAGGATGATGATGSVSPSAAPTLLLPRMSPG